VPNLLLQIQTTLTRKVASSVEQITRTFQRDSLFESLMTTLSPLSPSIRCQTKLKVSIKRYHAVALWKWNAGQDEVCGICQSPFEGVAPGVKYPGDECPVVWGKCGHSFHLQCISTWLGTNRNSCPICRREWEFADEKEVIGDDDEDDDTNN